MRWGEKWGMKTGGVRMECVEVVSMCVCERNWVVSVISFLWFL